MPVQTPLVAYGLSEAIDLFVIQQLRLLFSKYTNQQQEPKEVEVEATWNKVAPSTYPFVGVMTHIPRYEPIFIGDAASVDEQTGTTYTETVNNALVGLHIEAQELRELARVREFIYLNLEKGKHPLTQQPWLNFFALNNIVIKYFDPSEPEQMNFETIQMRTARAEGREVAERTDLETLWYIDMDICCDVAFNVPLLSDQGVITGVDIHLQIDTNLEHTR